MVETPSVMRDISGNSQKRDKGDKTNKAEFDNNSYSIIKQNINKSPKMSKYIKEVYDAGKYHSQMVLNNRSRTTAQGNSPIRGASFGGGISTPHRGVTIVSDESGQQIRDQMDKGVLMAVSTKRGPTLNEQLDEFKKSNKMNRPEVP